MSSYDNRTPFESLPQCLFIELREEDVPLGKDSGECYFRRNRDFTVYRTAYEPASDQYWPALLADMQAHVTAEVNTRTNDQLDDEAREVLSLFRPDHRSDEQRLAGLDMPRLRQLYLQTHPTRDCRTISDR